MYTKEEIIRLAKEIHGNKYDYSITEGVQNKGCKIRYRCPIHNIIIEQTLGNHLQGKGCHVCAKEVRRKGVMFTKEEFIESASKRHSDMDKYDWDKVDFNYRDNKGKIHLFCKEHGEFSIQPRHFINGVGCQYCNNRQKKDEDVIKELSLIHPLLDFSKTKYSEKDSQGKIMYICPIHGIKYSRYWNLKNGEGCYECSMIDNGEKHRLTNEEIIKRGEEKYGKSVYTYEKLDTQNRLANDKIIITCPEHGDFAVSIYNFITGKSGCPKCKQSKMEIKIKSFLLNNNIKFEEQKTFEWLIYKKNLYCDFYLPNENIVIECQGKQHFQPVPVFGGDENFVEVQKRDNIKKMLCSEHNIEILYFMESRYKKNTNDFSSLKELLKRINKS